MTPLEFARSLNYDLEDTILLSNDPRHEYDAVYSIKNSDIVVGRRSVRYVNVPSAVMVAAVTTQLDVSCFLLDVEQLLMLFSLSIAGSHSYLVRIRC